MSDLYKSLLQGLNEAVEHEKGTLTLKTAAVEINPVEEFTAKEVKTIRNNLNMSQSVFAVLMGVSNKTVEAWEAGTNKPSGSARRLLGMLKEDSNIPQKYNIVVLK